MFDDLPMFIDLIRFGDLLLILSRCDWFSGDIREVDVDGWIQDPGVLLPAGLCDQLPDPRLLPLQWQVLDNKKLIPLAVDIEATKNILFEFLRKWLLALQVLQYDHVINDAD